MHSKCLFLSQLFLCCCFPLLRCGSIASSNAVLCADVFGKPIDKQAWESSHVANLLLRSTVLVERMETLAKLAPTFWSTNCTVETLVCLCFM